MDDSIDLLQIKIQKAKSQLSEDTLNAIASVPWQATILKMRETKGYSFEQLGDLELETELLLCGLISSASYPKELQDRMRISQAQANELVLEMNKEVFSKIKEELIKISERKNTLGSPSRIPVQDSPIKPLVSEDEKNTLVFKTAGIEITSEGEKKPESIPVLKPSNLVKLEPAVKTTPAPIINPPLSGIDGKKLEISMVKKITTSDPVPLKPTMPSILAQKLSGAFQIPSVKTEHTLPNIAPSSIATETIKGKSDPYREIPE